MNEHNCQFLEFEPTVLARIFWRRLSSMVFFPLDFIPEYIISQCVLHNVRILEYEWQYLPLVPHNEGYPPGDDEKARGIQKRLDIMNILPLRLPNPGIPQLYTYPEDNNHHDDDENVCYGQLEFMMDSWSLQHFIDVRRACNPPDKSTLELSLHNCLSRKYIKLCDILLFMLTENTTIKSIRILM